MPSLQALCRIGAGLLKIVENIEWRGDHHRIAAMGTGAIHMIRYWEVPNILFPNGYSLQTER